VFFFSAGRKIEAKITKAYQSHLTNCFRLVPLDFP